MPVISRPEFRNSRDPGIKDLVEHFENGRFARCKTSDELYSLCTSSEIDAITQEIRHCQADFRYAAKNYFWMQNKNGEEQLFSLWPSQEILLETIEWLQRKGLPAKILIIKARQLGMSLFAEALCAHQTMFFPNKTALVCSWERPHSAYLFSYMLNIYEKMPLFLRPEPRSLKMEEGLKFDIGSSISVQWANKLKGVGQGMRLNMVHLSEFADFYKPQEVIEEDMKYALVNDSRTIAILESTAKGAGTFAHDFWKKMVALGERAGWYPLFLPWFMEPKRVMAPPHGWRPREETKVMISTVKDQWLRCSSPICRQYHPRVFGGVDRDGHTCHTCGNGALRQYELSKEQCVFMENELDNAPDKKKVQQELATDAITAFIVSGNPVFPEDAIANVAGSIRTPRYNGVFLSDNLFHAKDITTGKCIVTGCNIDHSNIEDPIKVWELPDPKRLYYMAIDVASGLGGTHDNSVIWINRLNRAQGTDYQVASFVSNTVDPYELAKIATRLGYWYNTCEIAVEGTGLGRSCADALRMHTQYPNLYRRKKYEKDNVITNNYWFETNVGSKPILVTTGIRWLKSKAWIVRDEMFAEEMKTFTKETEEKKIQAVSGFQDDRVMAGLICLFCSHELDYDEHLNYIPIKAAKTLEESQWIMSCDKCLERWGSEDPSLNGCCPKCGSIFIRGNRNASFVPRVSTDSLIDMHQSFRPETEEALPDELHMN